MEINRKSTLENVCEAVSGTWERSINGTVTITEIKDVTFVRVRVISSEPVILPIDVTSPTPYAFYTSNSVSGGIILPGQKSLKFDSTGILDYYVL